MGLIIGQTINTFPSMSTIGSVAVLFIGLNFIDFGNDWLAISVQNIMLTSRFIAFPTSEILPCPNYLGKSLTPENIRFRMVLLNRNIRLVIDALGVACLVLLFGICLYSLIEDVIYWGPSGIFLGRLLNRNDGGGVHTLSVLVVMIPMVLWGRKSGMNMGLVFAAVMLTDYYHEALWNIPYYLYYGEGTNLPEYLLMGVLCFMFFGALIYKGRKAHNFRHVLYLLPWFVMVTLYVLFVHQYSESIFAVSYYLSVPVSAYEIFEVGFFSVSLYFGLSSKKDGEPIGPYRLYVASGDKD